MTTRRLVNNDYSFGQGSLNMISGLEALHQSCMTRLRQFQGEWFLNEEDGTAWKAALAQRYDKNKLKQIIKSRLLGVIGVIAVPSITVIFSTDTRLAEITASIKTIYGDTQLSDSFELLA